MTFGNAVAIALLGSLLPIWRVPGQPDTGANFWKYTHDFLSGKVTHVPIEQARKDAGIIYRQREEL